MKEISNQESPVGLSNSGSGQTNYTYHHDHPPGRLRGWSASVSCQSKRDWRSPKKAPYACSCCFYSAVMNLTQVSTVYCSYCNYSVFLQKWDAPAVCFNLSLGAKSDSSKKKQVFSRNILVYRGAHTNIPSHPQI